MMIKLNMKCKKCKRRLTIELDPNRPSGELAKLAAEMGWSWHNNGDLFCPEH